jgi:hypothetical protein
LAVIMYALAIEEPAQRQQFTVEQLRETMESIAEVQLERTVFYLAKDDPLYEASFTIKQSSEFSSSLPWIVVGAVLVLIGVALVIVAVFASRKSHAYRDDLELEAQ